jgi:hypothetical protein
LCDRWRRRSCCATGILARSSRRRPPPSNTNPVGERNLSDEMRARPRRRRIRPATCLKGGGTARTSRRCHRATLSAGATSKQPRRSAEHPLVAACESSPSMAGRLWLCPRCQPSTGRCRHRIGSVARRGTIVDAARPLPRIQIGRMAAAASRSRSLGAAGMPTSPSGKRRTPSVSAIRMLHNTPGQSHGHCKIARRCVRGPAAE